MWVFNLANEVRFHPRVTSSKLNGQVGSSPRSLRVVSMATCCLCSSWSLRPYSHPIRQYTRNQHCHSKNCYGSPLSQFAHTTPKEFVNRERKTHQLFSAHTTSEKFENTTFSIILELGQKKSRDYREIEVFEKFLFQNAFRKH